MKKLLVAVLCSLSLPAFASDPVFDGGASLASKPIAHHEEGGLAIKPQGPRVWISIAKEDLPGLQAMGVELGPQILAGGQTGVYNVDEAFLPVLSKAMHEKFNKCGGFFTYESKEAAEGGLFPIQKAVATAYTLDQEAVVKPLVTKATEAGIRASIVSQSSRHDRFYKTDDGAAAAKALASAWTALVKGLPGAKVQLVKHPQWKQNSVIATIPGTDLAAETVVLGGHLDSINGWGGSGKAPGADDNASGIATLTEALRVLSESGWKPRRSVAFMGYAAEEVGLRGSQEIAEAFRGEGRSVAGVLQLDMTNFAGSGDKMFFVTDHTDAGLTEFLSRLNDAYIGVPSSTFACGYGCSDHASWNQNGYPSSCAFESEFDAMNPNIHSEKDTLANSGGSAQHSVKFAKLAIAFAVELAKTAQ